MDTLHFPPDSLFLLLPHLGRSSRSVSIGVVKNMLHHASSFLSLTSIGGRMFSILSRCDSSHGGNFSSCPKASTGSSRSNPGASVQFQTGRMLQRLLEIKQSRTNLYTSSAISKRVGNHALTFRSTSNLIRWVVKDEPRGNGFGP